MTKRFYTLLLTAILTVTASAQNQKGDIDGDGLITVSDITALINHYLTGDEEEKVDTTLFHAFDGYILVTSSYFTNSYYGNNAQLSVYKTSADEYIVTFSDPQWGDAVFGNVSVGRELSGQGTLTMAYRGKVSDYDATISGPMTAPVISMADVMGGTAITFYPGTAPLAYTTEGNYKGTNNVVVGGQYPYDADITYKITANTDGTINITVPEFQLTGTVMGDLTLGTYTITGIAYDETRGAFYRDYTNDGLTMHMTAVNNGNTTMDSDYTFETNGADIEVKTSDDGITVVNNFQPGRMPFPIAATFNGIKTPVLK